MPEFIRVRNERGDEYSIVASSFDSEIHTKVKDADAADANGGALPAKPAESRSSQKAAATTQKENS